MMFHGLQLLYMITPVRRVPHSSAISSPGSRQINRPGCTSAIGQSSHGVANWPSAFFSRHRTELCAYASFTLAHFYHTFSASIGHILFACVNAPHILRVARLRCRILRVEKLACQLFATRKMRQKVSINTNKTFFA